MMMRHGCMVIIMSLLLLLSFYCVLGTILNSFHKYLIFTSALSEGPILWMRKVRLRDVKEHAHVYPLCKEQS